MPLPRQLAMKTVPARAACTRPGTPSSESPRSSSGSQKSSSSRRRITSTGLQAGERLEIHAAVAHRQIGAAHQREVPLPREERVLEVGFAVRPGRHHHDARVGRAVRREAEQRLDRDLEEVGERPHAALVEHGRQRPSAHQPVLERVAGARRRLRAVGDHPPGAVRATARCPPRSCAGRRRSWARCRGRRAGSLGCRRPAPAARGRRGPDGACRRDRRGRR